MVVLARSLINTGILLVFKYPRVLGFSRPLSSSLSLPLSPTAPNKSIHHQTWGYKIEGSRASGRSIAHYSPPLGATPSDLNIPAFGDEWEGRWRWRGGTFRVGRQERPTHRSSLRVPCFFSLVCVQTPKQSTTLHMALYAFHTRVSKVHTTSREDLNLTLEILISVHPSSSGHLSISFSRYSSWTSCRWSSLPQGQPSQPQGQACTSTG